MNGRASFADRLALARRLIARRTAPSVHLADQLKAAGSEARVLHDRLGDVLPVLEPDRNWRHRTDHDPDDDTRALLLRGLRQGPRPRRVGVLGAGGGRHRPVCARPGALHGRLRGGDRAGGGRTGADAPGGRFGARPAGPDPGRGARRAAAGGLNVAGRRCTVCRHPDRPARPGPPNKIEAPLPLRFAATDGTPSALTVADLLILLARRLREVADRGR